jgi:hypothetical protein
VQRLQRKQCGQAGRPYKMFDNAYEKISIVLA